jgi:hypothetical protein
MKYWESDLHPFVFAVFLRFVGEWSRALVIFVDSMILSVDSHYCLDIIQNGYDKLTYLVSISTPGKYQQMM